MCGFSQFKKIASNWHETTEFEGLSASTLLKFKIRIQHGNILKHLKVLMHETKKINLVLREKLRRSWAELQYVWCDWQLGLKLFIIQYGWLSDEAKGGWREKASRRGVGGDMVHFVVHLRAGNVIFFFFFFHFMNTFYFVYWACQCCYPTVYIQSNHLFTIMQYSPIAQLKILLFMNL